MNKEIVDVFVETTKKFRDAVSAFSEEQLNGIPHEGGWTGAQVADHVLRSQSRFPQLLGGKKTEANRPIDEKKETVAKIFLDFTTKMKSPEFILPTGEPLDKNVLIKRIDESAGNMVTAIRENDLSTICLDFVLPNIGEFTGLEWCWFQIFHTQRHTRQLENIFKAINKLKSTPL